MLLIEIFGGVRMTIINQDVASKVGNPFAHPKPKVWEVWTLKRLKI